MTPPSALVWSLEVINGAVVVFSNWALYYERVVSVAPSHRGSMLRWVTFLVTNKFTNKTTPLSSHLLLAARTCWRRREHAITRRYWSITCPRPSERWPTSLKIVQGGTERRGSDLPRTVLWSHLGDSPSRPLKTGIIFMTSRDPLCLVTMLLGLSRKGRQP